MSTKEYRKTKDLKLWEQNPRSIRKEDFERLKKQIQELGQYKPLIITKDGEVIGGNMRLRAYRELGIEDVWVSVVDPKDDMEKLKYALSDNDRAGYYDDDLLANLSSAFPDFEWSDYAVDLTPPETLDKVLFKEEVQEDEVPEVSDEEPISKLGEVYQLGRHRLLCGDSTKIEDVEKLMNGQKADMVFTDPPYGMGRDIVNDDLPVGDLVEWNKRWVRVVSGLLKEGGIFISFHSPRYFWTLLGLSDELLFQRYLVLYKPNDITYPHFNWVIKTEAILLFSKGKPTMFQKYKGNYETDVYIYNHPAKYEDDGLWHPTIKPVEICADMIRKCSVEDNIILDLFGGSGSTLIACEQLNRTCYMMEIDPKYCDVIRKRYARFIGKEDEWEKVSPRI